jgi:hypothetical protein
MGSLLKVTFINTGRIFLEVMRPARMINNLNVSLAIRRKGGIKPGFITMGLAKARTFREFGLVVVGRPK